MTRRLSLTARTHAEAEYSDEVEVVLIHVSHSSWDQPLRLSTDPTERLSREPVRYGTRSAWMGADPASQPYEFCVTSMQLPGDQEDAPAEIRLVLDVFDSSVVTLLRSLNTRAVMSIAVVMASQPSVVEVEFLGLEVVGADYGQQIVVTATRKPVEEEAVPMDRFTKNRFPGLFP